MRLFLLVQLPVMLSVPHSMTIKRGDADIMVCGGSEAAITPMGIGGFNSMKALSTRNDEPSRQVGHLI